MGSVPSVPLTSLAAPWHWLGIPDFSGCWLRRQQSKDVYLLSNYVYASLYIYTMNIQNICYGLNVCVTLPNSYTEALPSSGMVFGEGVCRRVGG